ncbi:MAG: hypothetical protein ACRD1L_09835, partial [Terriglobales bacterium]
MRWFAAALIPLAAALAAAQSSQSQSLPPPYATPSVSNSSRWVAPPASWSPAVPEGFTVSVFADGLSRPRWLAVAPNGDVFVADTLPHGDVVVLHAAGAASSRAVFAGGLTQPFGIAFHDNYVYIGDNDEVIRFRYDP